MFFAPLPWTSLQVCPAEIYARFGEPFDREVLAAVAEAPFNMLHVCGNEIAIERFYDYPVAALNWDNFGEGNPSLSEVARASGKVVAGGIPHRKLHRLTAETLEPHARAALRDAEGRILLAGGCGIGALTPTGPRAAVRTVAEALGPGPWTA